MAVDGIERFRAACGALMAIVLTGLATRLMLGPTAQLPVLIAPMGASAVLLFAQPASPLAQPWPIVGGNIISAAIGVACARWIGEPMLAASLAVACAIIAMFALRCLHPPGGAIALSAVLGGPAIQSAGFDFVWAPVALNSLLLLAVAFLFNNATRRRYPHWIQPDHSSTHQTADIRPGDRLGFTPDDLDDVLKRYNQVLDISRDDLEELFLETEKHAYRRRFGEIACADIMSRDVVTAESGTTLEEAWNLLRRHQLKALPVVDPARRVVGIITLSDFLKHARLDGYVGFDQKLRRFLRRTWHARSTKPEVVAQVMTRTVQTVRADTHVVDLVPLLSDIGLHHIPVVDQERRLAGMVSQSDLIAALYRGRLTDVAEAA